MDANAIRVYIKPFDIDGTYTSFEEVTRFVKKIGKVATEIDSSDYQVGIFRNSNVTIKLNNRDGTFSDVDVLQSMFGYTRKDSIVKITYSNYLHGFQCGITPCGSRPISEEVTLFEGLLNDESYRLSATNEDASFTILGYESLFDRVEVPFSLLSNGDSISEIIYDCLNQTTITDLLTVSVGNINPDEDLTSDDVSWLENETVTSALNKLLLVSNSILYIKDSVVYITNRDPSASVEFNFYGQASQNGAENIKDILGYNNGAHRVFNYFTWKDTSVKSSDPDSINLFGVKKKEINFEIYTNSTKQETFLDALLAEFKDAKEELEIKTPLNFDTIALNLLDKTDIDYPTIYYSEERELPICGVAICGEAILPIGFWNLTISTEKNYKILRKEHDLENLISTFKLREV